MSETSDSISSEQLRLRVALRISSFAFTSIVAILALLFAWRRNDAQGFEMGAFSVSISLYMAIYLNRRSRGLHARVFLISTGPHHDENQQGLTDYCVLWGSVVWVACVAYMFWKYW